MRARVGLLDYVYLVPTTLFKCTALCSVGRMLFSYFFLDVLSDVAPNLSLSRLRRFVRTLLVSSTDHVARVMCHAICTIRQKALLTVLINIILFLLPSISTNICADLEGRASKGVV
jgi:hypothetical protein